MKELKDYLHLYLFADFMAIPQHSMNREYEQCRIKGLLTRGTEIEMVGVEGVPFFSFIPDIKPILRPLSDMTEEEILNFERAQQLLLIEKKVPMWNNKDIPFLLSKHFDLFGLIEAGLAIDKTKTHTT